MDAAEENGIDLYYCSRAGADSCSAARQISGVPADQSDQSFLYEDQIQAGYVLLDVAYPMSRCTFIVNIEEELY